MSAEPVKVSIGAFQNRRRRGSSFIINHNWVHAQCAASVLKPRPDEKKNGSVSLMWFIKKKKKNSNFRWKGFSVDKALQLQGISNS